MPATAQRAAAPPTPDQLLARFGLSSFRPGQREAVQAALDGRDSLVVMPTGAGKSLCYQLPALDESDPGRPLVLVVSPLIALMDDQRGRLERAGVSAAMLASSQDPSQNAAELARIADGEAKIALVAPERFAARSFREALGRRRVGLFVVDEAHCVAEWGHDFRPDYLRLHDAIEALGRPPVMASTATATPRVAAEIATRLGLRDWVKISGGFDRPSISFDVVTVEGKGALTRKRAALAHVLGDASNRPAIVYCGTRKDTEALSAEIACWGISVVAYHAGMSASARRAAQEAFMGGQVEVIVATNAFGMGVDKAEVRTVAHWAIPTSLEGYYQEAGRGGRDGLPARALLLAARMDLGRLIRFNTERDITVAEVRAFVGRLRAGAESQGDRHVALIDRGELDDRGRLLLSIAERAGAAVLEPGSGGSLLVELTCRGSPREAHLAIKAAQDRGWEAYRSIERFVSNTEVCRRRQLLAHFGDSQRMPPLGRCCDICDPDPELAAAVVAASVAPVRSRRQGGAARPAAGIAGGGGSSVLPIETEIEAEPVDEQAFEALRQWRIARAEGKPAYTVATNAVLEEVLRRRPAAERELLAIKGVGPAFCAKHGDSLLAELARM